jgi:hypothetical protein
MRYADMEKYIISPRIASDLVNGSLRYERPFACKIECELIHAGKIIYRQIHER